MGDVGLSRMVTALQGGGAGSAVQGKSSMLVGTLGYLDPEYLRTGRFGPRSDVYSLGVVMLQVLTGKQVYEEDMGDGGGALLG